MTKKFIFMISGMIFGLLVMIFGTMFFKKDIFLLFGAVITIGSAIIFAEDKEVEDPEDDKNFIEENQ